MLAFVINSLLIENIFIILGTHFGNILSMIVTASMTPGIALLVRVRTCTHSEVIVETNAVPKLYTVPKYI